MLEESIHDLRRIKQMTDSATSPSSDSRFLRKLAAIGCLVNVVLFMVLAGLCVVFLVAIARSLDYTPHAVDEHAIREVLDDQVAAWNRGDLDGFMAGYWHDERLRFTSRDKVEYGWEATRDGYIRRYKSNPKGMGKLSFNELEIEFPSPTVALVRGQFVLIRGVQKDTGRFTLVFRKFADGWKITSDHTSAADKKES